MRRTLLVGAAGVLSAFALAATAGAAGTSTPTLVGTVGPGFTITLTKGGKTVKSLPAGRYRFVIRDRSAIHDFALAQQRGGRARITLTTVPFIGTKTAFVRLARGVWRFYCPPHASIMFGTFAVR